MSQEKSSEVEKYDKAMRPGGPAGEGYQWHDPKETPFNLGGFAWLKTDGIYRRMPAKPAETLPEAVDSLANCTAGGQLRFQTDSRKLAVRVKLHDKADMNHMPATGQCGFDCYIGPPRQMRFCNVTKYDHHLVEYEHVLFDFDERRMRNITLNFPLYMGVDELHVGLEPDARILAPPAWEIPRRIVVYGTSITQGGCASRPGMCYTNILSRRLNVEFVNLGFSGSGRGEPEVARTIAEISDPACLVLDYEGNCPEFERLRETFPAFIRILRKAHPAVPVVGVSRIAFAGDLHKPKGLQMRLKRAELQRHTIEEMVDAGDENLYFVDGSTFLGEDDFDECTVDGVHPTDLGFLRMAEALRTVFEDILL
jgi:hypothetical protein